MRGARAIRAQHGLPELSELDPALVRLPRWEVVLSLAVPWLCLGIYAAAGLMGWWPVAVLGVVLLSFFTYGPSRALWQAVLVTGAAGFGTAIGVHFPIGYTAITHLAPAYLGALMWSVGLVLTYPAMKR